MFEKNIWLLICVIVFLWIFLPPYSRMQDLKRKNIVYQQKIEQLEQENVRLQEERYRLEEDPVYLEKIAREKMGLIREGEVIYRLTPMNKEDRVKEK